MRNYSKILTLSLGIFFLIAASFSYYRFYIERDYILYGHTECDPSQDRCFVYECDPEIEECTGNTEEDIEYYALIEKNASRVSVCNPSIQECEALKCALGETDCKVSFCDETLAEKEKVSCSDPEDFQEESSNEDSEETEEVSEPDTVEGDQPEQEEGLQNTEKATDVPALP